MGRLHYRPMTVLPGSLVGVVAPASPVDPDRFSRGIEELKSRGYSVEVPFDPSACYQKPERGFFSASREHRWEALQQLFANPEVSAIFCVRGGYGSQELLDLIDYDLLSTNPKPLIGYSDCTALLLAAWSKAGVAAIHGPSVGVEFAAADKSVEAKDSVDRLMELLEGRVKSLNYRVEVIKEGAGSGPLIAGNLSMLVSLLGTPWDINYDGAVLALEDIGEAPYRLHRLLLQMVNAGKFARLSGLVFGRFSRCDSVQGGVTWRDAVRDIVETYLGNARFPVAWDCPFGHDGENFPLPLGCTATLDERGFYMDGLSAETS